MPPLALLQARYLCMRLRPHYPELKLMLGIWQTNVETLQAKLPASLAAQPAVTLADAVTRIVAMGDFEATRSAK